MPFSASVRAVRMAPYAVNIHEKTRAAMKARGSLGAYVDLLSDLAGAAEAYYSENRTYVGFVPSRDPAKGNPPGNFAGDMDDVRIYSGVLSEPEIAELEVLPDVTHYSFLPNCTAFGRSVARPVCVDPDGAIRSQCFSTGGISTGDFDGGGEEWRRVSYRLRKR